MSNNVAETTPNIASGTSIMPPPISGKVKPNSLQSKGSASSIRSETRRQMELEMQKLEEEFKMEKRFVEKKYTLLREYVSETSSVAENGEDDGDDLSKVAEWLTETDCQHEPIDSGLVEEGTNEQTPNRSGKLEGKQIPDVQRTQNPASSRHYQIDQCSQRDLSIPLSQHAKNKCFVPTSFENQHHYHPSQRIHLYNKHQTPFANGFSQQARSQLGAYPEQSSQLHSGCNPREAHSEQCETRNVQFAQRQWHSQVPVGATFSGFAPGQRSTPEQFTYQKSDPPRINDETVCILNRSQIAARQAVSQDLPEFDGCLEDWPLFYAMFKSSTQMCGYTNEENMLRLRKCLKGKALEAVRCELLHPSNVSDILSTLKMLYGRSDAIIQSIVNKIRDLPPLNMNKLETVVNFALTVKNLVATIRACDINDFIFNASLRYELVERLPSPLKLDWARYTRDFRSPNLSDFSSWLYAIAVDASSVMVSSNHEQQMHACKRDETLNYDSESDTSSGKLIQLNRKSNLALNHSDNERCIVCKGSCSTVAKCDRFEEFSLDSRWATVKECKLCRQCLRKHNGSCRLQKRCGITGCTFMHHPLLHKSESQNNRVHSTNMPIRLPEPTLSEPSCNIHQSQSEVLFRIVPIALYGPKQIVHTYAFIDDGSEITLMEQSLADELGVDGPKSPLCLKWTGGTRKMESQSKLVNVQISGIQSTNKYDLTEVSTIPALHIRPQTVVPSELQKRFPYLADLPIEEYRDASPRILIGLDYAHLGYGIKSQEGMRNEPIAVKTRLGWMVYGNCIGRKESTRYVNYHSVHRATCDIISSSSSGRMVHSEPDKVLGFIDTGVGMNTLPENPPCIPGGVLRTPRRQPVQQYQNPSTRHCKLLTDVCEQSDRGK